MMPATSRTTVTVVTPTLNRHRPLRRALESIFAQEIAGDLQVELVVVDNSVDSNARTIVTELSASSRYSVLYVAEPRPGVATARNAGVAAAKGDFIAFLDDDEEASPGWLAAMVACAERTGADACFGPITARAEEGASLGPFAPMFSREWQLSDATEVTSRAAYLGTNNALFKRAALSSGNRPFAQSLDSSGGEDSLLLQELVSRGGSLVWCAAGRVVEWVPDRRLNWAYLRRRTFLSGQIRTFVQAMLQPRRHANVLFWMGIGLTQALVYGAGAVCARVLNRERAELWHVKACGGLGKVFWMKRFRPSLYGSGLVS